MGHPQPMAASNRHHQLLENRRGVRLGEAVPGREAVVQIAPVAEISDEVEIIVVLVDAVQVKDVGTAGEEAQNLGLGVEAASVGGVGGQGVLVDGFTGKIIVRKWRVTAVDDSESAAAELFAQLVICFEAVEHYRY